MKTFGLALLLSLGAVLEAQTPGVKAQVKLVRALYSQFACEAVLVTPTCDSSHQTTTASKDILRKFFDARLTTLWLADRQCARKSGEICKIDFAPLWASQDPTGASVNISLDATPSDVNVEIAYPGDKSAHQLHFSLVRISGQWRIHDIEEVGKWSMLRLLTQTSTATETAQPKDIAQLAERVRACQHFSGEINGDRSDRDKQVFAAMAQLRCEKTEDDVKMLRKKYAGNQAALAALDSLMHNN